MNHWTARFAVLSVPALKPAFYQRLEKESIMKNPVSSARKNPKLHVSANIDLLNETHIYNVGFAILHIKFI